MNRPTERVGRNRPAQLREQLAEAGFPRGIGVASVTTFVLLILVTGFTATYLATAGPLSLFGADAPAAAVPGAVLEAQHRAAVSLSQAVAASATGSAGDLRIAASSGLLDSADTDQVLTRLSQTYPNWRGLAVLDTASGNPLGSHGEPVPAEALRDLVLDRVTVRPVPPSGGSPLVLTAVPLSGPRDGQLLAVSTALHDTSTDPDKDARHSVRLVAGDGTVLDSHGPALPATDRATLGLVDQAVSEAGAGNSGVLAGAGVAEGNGQVAPVVAYAPVTVDGLGANPGLSLVSVSRLPLETMPARYPGLIPAAALLGLAAGGFVLLRRVVVAPIRRLRSDALAVASGELERPVRQSRVKEVRGLTAAIEHYRLRLSRRARAGMPATARISAGMLVALVTLSLLGWSVAVSLTVGRQHTEASPAMMREHGLRATRSADTLRRSLTEGLSDLQAVARLGAGKPAERLRPMLDQLAANEVRFRSVYLTGPDGEILLSSGRAALREGGKPPAGEGIRQHNTSGRIPVVYAYANFPGSDQVVIGEFDVTRMSALLDAAGGRVRVVDAGNRTIADTQGYLAFEELTDDALRKNVAAAHAGNEARETTESVLIAAQGLAAKGNAAALHWVVVAEQPVGMLGGAPDNAVRAGAHVASLLTAVVALSLFGWHHLMVLRPLRRVANAAERVAKGNTGSVVYPQRQDEIGTIASCVEICRQGLSEGTGRLGEARRPRGAATDPTELIAHVPEPVRTARPATRPAKRAAEYVEKSEYLRWLDRTSAPAARTIRHTPVRRPARHEA